MANSPWGLLNWGQGTFGGINDATVSLTGINLQSYQGSVDAGPDANLTGEQLTLTEASVSITVDAYPIPTGEQLTGITGDPSIIGTANFSVSGQHLDTYLDSVTVTAEINRGWGRLTWGSLPWGGEITNVTTNVTGEYLTTTLNSVDAAPDANLTGEQLTLTLDFVNTQADATAQVTGQYLDTPLGEVDANPDAVVYGEVANLTPGDLTITGTGNLSLNGEQLLLTQNNVEIDIAVEVLLESQTLSLTFNPNVTVTGIANVPVTGQHVDTFEGEVDVSPDAEVVGIEAALARGNISVKIDVNVAISGQNLTLTEESVTVEVLTPVPVTGEGLTLTLDSVTTKVDITAILTGNSLTGYTGQLYSTAWQVVDTGLPSVWTPVNTAA